MDRGKRIRRLRGASVQRQVVGVRRPDPWRRQPSRPEANAEVRALADMNDFLGFITQTYFPEFETYPALAKMGILDLAYNVGADDARFDYKETAAAVLRRNWKKAGIEQRTNREVGRVDVVQAWFNQAARKEHFFISHTNCQKNLSNLV